MLDIILARVTVEVVSTIICIILVRFMVKPYQLTKEARYLGLPLGFGFLAVSYAFAAITFSQSYYHLWGFSWLQLLVRTYAFVFFAMTYYFSKKPSKKTRLLWDITLSLIVVTFVALFIGLNIQPEFSIISYNFAQLYIRIFSITCLSYIAIQTLRSHIKKPDTATIWTPLGFILLGISQYSLLFFYTDSSFAAFTGALVTRLMALAVFLLVSYRTFYGSGKKEDEK
jgi:hypothetical protein